MPRMIFAFDFALAAAASNNKSCKLIILVLGILIVLVLCSCIAFPIFPRILSSQTFLWFSWAGATMADWRLNGFLIRTTSAGVEAPRCHNSGGETASGSVYVIKWRSTSGDSCGCGSWHTLVSLRMWACATRHPRNCYMCVSLLGNGLVFIIL